MKDIFTLTLTLGFISIRLLAASSIKIDNNGYSNILIALPPNLENTEDRTRMINNLKNLLLQSSEKLMNATKGRAYFRNVIFITPSKWNDTDYLISQNSTSAFHAETELNREDADIVVTDSIEDTSSYVLHHRGCGYRALKIYLSTGFLLSSHVLQNSSEFVRLWAEYRYGLFPEGGFPEDEKYPLTYQLPWKSTSSVTGCSSGKHCVYVPGSDDESCEEQFTSSLMDQHLTKASFFCEVEHYLGVRHFPEVPSKHNLLCHEEGTWFTVLRSPDFAKGRNAAKRNPPSPDVNFQYAKELLAPRVVVAIETTSQMNIQSRYSLTKNAFSRFVLYDLPYGSELTLCVFENGEPSLITSSLRLEDERSRSRYLEGQPLPESPSQDSEPCSECLLEYILQSDTEGNNTSPSPHIVILVTTQEYLNGSRYPALKQQLLESKIELHAFLFPSANEEYENHKFPLYRLLSETGGQLVAVREDILGNLYRGFTNAVRGYKTHDLILQEYLPTEDEEDLTVQFAVDAALSQNLRISFSGPQFETAPLVYESTTINGSGIQDIYLQKQELVPAWIFQVPSPQPGTYTISTRRKRDAITPVLLTVTGKTNEAEDPLSVKVWTEILTETKIVPPPVLIFAEIKQGSYPVSGANVVAYVHHPRNGTISELPLIDDGLGDIDVTRDDGIYTRYFTDFTAAGFYNVYVKFSNLNNSAEILKGPSAKCCGSFFPSRRRINIGPFQREAGPATFHVEAVNETDVYPPARVTDLRIVKISDRIFALNWTAVGEDYDSGVAAAYEVKLFPSRFLVSYQFSNSGLEVYSATVETTPLAVYGTTLYHLAKLSKKTHGGVYYFFVRALDHAGNAGLLSNAVPVLVENVNHSSSINCEDEDLPIAQKREDSAFTSRPFFFLILLLVILHLL